MEIVGEGKRLGWSAGGDVREEVEQWGEEACLGVDAKVRKGVVEWQVCQWLPGCPESSPPVELGVPGRACSRVRYLHIEQSRIS